ncbi:nucleoside deaminase [Candidatus Mesenet endosymbiont of Phosphuga atrata]|uniref:nucleoside deaminase n=1 Tax=Candidatus Mesenet endosymbiont of Phosphuga atrata TaxID=3066221 RepID=UPI0030CD96D3
MKMALRQAQKTKDEIPVGVVIVKNEKAVSSAHNKTIALSNPIAHAEILAINEATSSIGKLFDCDMYVTLEPCPMCAQAISFSRIRRLYFGAYNKKGESIENGARIFKFCSYVPEVYGGILESESSLLLKHFFTKLREKDIVYGRCCELKN